MKTATVILYSLVALLAQPAVSGAAQRYARSVHGYQVPDVTLVDQDRQPVPLKQLLQTDKPVLLDFFYASCTTICPVLSAGFANLQKKIPGSTTKLQLISISIDPEHDTPEVLRAYLKRYRAKPGWTFLTGQREDIYRVMHAMDAFVPDKMSHFPLTLILDHKTGQWTRIDGLIGTRDLISELASLYPDIQEP